MKKVLVTGAGGLVGSSLQRVSALEKDSEYVFVDRKTCDLTEQQQVVDLFNKVA